MSDDPGLVINTILPQLRQTLASGNRCLLVAQPGAGKTTRVPLALIDSDTHTWQTDKPGRWLLLEPRRVAARLAATFMAAQLGEAAGQRVGYRVRGESKVSASTRLEIVTQGILTRMLQDDPSLDGVRGVIFDEFHERSLDADLGLALTLDVQGSLRPDLKLLIMSATLDVDSLLTVLGPETPVINCPGRSFAVATHYRPGGTRAAIEQHQAAVVREALAAHHGHVLMFLPGQKEIRRLHAALASSLPADVDIMPLHGQLSLAEQQKVLTPSTASRRRVILSTAIAESSVTVPGVRIVIDAGRERVPVYQPRSGMTRLVTRQVNRASADQRRGRAGREAPGVCYRLWSGEQVLVPHSEPEIVQSDLSGLLFELARWGVADTNALPWVTPPPPPALASARQLLQNLGLLQGNGQSTALGQQTARWPTHPRIAVMLEHAASHTQDPYQLALACWLAAWMEESTGGTGGANDIDIRHMLELQIFRQDQAKPDRRWQQTARQWARRARCEKAFAALSPEHLAHSAVLLAYAWPDRLAARLEDGRYKLASGGQAWIPENHALTKHEFLVAVSMDGKPEGARIFHAIGIAQTQLESAFAKSLHWQDNVQWDDTAGRLTGEQQLRMGEVVVRRRPLGKLPTEAVHSALLAALRKREELRWSADDQQLLGRLRLVHRVLGGTWPDVSDAQLLASLENWLAPHLTGITRLEQIDRLPLGQCLLGSLDWSLQQQLPGLAPTHWQLPSGDRVRIDYSEEEPVLAAKLQALFGQTDTPTVVNGRVPLVVHLLSPARRPVQVTRDLASFWASTYFDVRRDLRGRYPKHPWPDDPLTATPTLRTRRK